MGKITQVETKIGIKFFIGKTVSYQDLQQSNYKNVNFGTAEDLLSDEETRKAKKIKKYLDKQISKLDIFVIWEANTMRILTKQINKQYEIILLNKKL